MHDPIEAIAFDLLDHRMHMIRHNYPSEQLVALAVEEIERLRDDRGVFPCPEQAIAATFVDQPMNQSLPLAVIGAAEDMLVDLAWQAVRQPEGDGLNDRAAVEMREIPALEPALVPAGRRRSQQDAHPPEIFLGPPASCRYFYRSASTERYWCVSSSSFFFRSASSGFSTAARLSASCSGLLAPMIGAVIAGFA